ncbi:MAG: hypothetical protein M3282_01960 [Gemmatimonadota bacterium]|nr:hypothetical protein [Gemmatimonadota bacterium]
MGESASAATREHERERPVLPGRDCYGARRANVLGADRGWKKSQQYREGERQAGETRDQSGSSGNEGESD